MASIYIIVVQYNIHSYDMKCKTFIIHLQGHTEEFDYIMVSKEQMTAKCLNGVAQF